MFYLFLHNKKVEFLSFFNKKIKVKADLRTCVNKTCNFEKNKNGRTWLGLKLRSCYNFLINSAFQRYHKKFCKCENSDLCDFFLLKRTRDCQKPNKQYKYTKKLLYSTQTFKLTCSGDWSLDDCVLYREPFKKSVNFYKSSLKEYNNNNGKLSIMKNYSLKFSTAAENKNFDSSLQSAKTYILGDKEDILHMQELMKENNTKLSQPKVTLIGQRGAVWENIESRIGGIYNENYKIISLAEPASSSKYDSYKKNRYFLRKLLNKKDKKKKSTYKIVNFFLENKKIRKEYKKKTSIFKGFSSRRRFYMFKKGLKNWKQFSFLKPNLKNKPFLLKSNWDNRKVWKDFFFFKHARRKNFFRNKSLIRLYFMRYLMLRKNSQLKSFLLKYKKGKGHLLRYHLKYESKLENFIIQWGFLRLLTLARSRFIIRAGFVYVDFVRCKNPYKPVQPVSCVTLTYAGSRAHTFFYHWTNLGSTKWHKALVEYRHLSRKKKIGRVIKLNGYRQIFWKFRMLKLSHWNIKYFSYFFRFFEASNILKAFVYFFFNEWYSYKFSKYFNFTMFDRHLNNIFLKTRLF